MLLPEQSTAWKHPGHAAMGEEISILWQGSTVDHNLLQTNKENQLLIDPTVMPSTCNVQNTPNTQAHAIRLVSYTVQHQSTAISGPGHQGCLLQERLL